MSVHNKRQVLVKEEVFTSVMPSTRAELFNEVILQSGFHVRGGIYAYTLQGSGEGIVEGPVLVKKEIVLTPPTDPERRMIFACGLNAGDAIQVKFPVRPKTSPVLEFDFNPFVIRGDICTGSLLLENTLMLGNIHCEDAVIKNSIILGTPVVRGELQLENSTVISARAGRVVFQGCNTMVFPFASCEGEFGFDYGECDPPPGFRGESWEEKAKVRYVGFCRSRHSGQCNERYSFTCSKFFEGECPHPEVFMTDNDVFSPRQQNNPTQYLSLVPRVIDMEPVKKDIEVLTNFIGILSALPHMDDRSREHFETQLKVEKEYAHFFNVFSYCTPWPGRKSMSLAGEDEKRVWQVQGDDGEDDALALETVPVQAGLDAGEDPALETGGNSDDDGCFDDGGATDRAVEEDRFEEWEFTAEAEDVALMEIVPAKKSDGDVRYAARMIGTIDGFGEDAYGELQDLLSEYSPESPVVVPYAGLAQKQGRVFLLREFVEGDSLGESLARGRTYSWGEARMILVQIAGILREFGMPHGALHGDNVILNDVGELCLMDYAMPGIAQIAAKAGGCEIPLRHPEYADARQDISVASDAACLGIMAVAMLEGEAGNVKHRLGKGLPNYKKRTGEALPLSVIQGLIRLLRGDFEDFVTLEEFLDELPGTAKG